MKVQDVEEQRYNSKDNTVLFLPLLPLPLPLLLLLLLIIIIIKDNHFYYHKDTYSINKSQSSFTNINNNITKYKFHLINFNYYKLLEQLQARYLIFLYCFE